MCVAAVTPPCTAIQRSAAAQTWPWKSRPPRTSPPQEWFRYVASELSLTLRQPHHEGVLDRSSSSCLSSDLPLLYAQAAAGVTKEWLSAVLGSPVASFELGSTGAAGFVSDTFRCTLSYESGGGVSAPESVVIKFSGEAESKRFLADGLGAYVQEHFAYETIARSDMLGQLRVPKVSLSLSLSLSLFSLPSP